jgi:hypothetical protein
MMHTEMGDHDKADDAEVAIDEEIAEEFSDEIPEETVVLPETEDSDNVGDVSVEINVEELVAEIEAAQDEDAHKKKDIHRRLEEIHDQREVSKELEDTFSMYLDDED